MTTVGIRRWLCIHSAVSRVRSANRKHTARITNTGVDRWSPSLPINNSWYCPPYRWFERKSCWLKVIHWQFHTGAVSLSCQHPLLLSNVEVRVIASLPNLPFWPACLRMIFAWVWQHLIDDIHFGCFRQFSFINVQGLVHNSAHLPMLSELYSEIVI